MTDTKAHTKPAEQPDDEQDVEGHNLYINPTIASDMARIRSKEIERQVRERNHVKEAKKEAKRS